MRKLLILMLVLGVASMAVATPTYVGSATITAGATETYQVVGSPEDASTNGVAGTGGWAGNVWIDYALYPGSSAADITAVSAATNEFGDPAWTVLDSTTYAGDAIVFTAYSNPTVWSELDDVDAALWFSFDLTAPGDAVEGTIYTINLIDEYWVDTGYSLAVEVIPEPMTMALLGLGGLFLRRRK